MQNIKLSCFLSNISTIIILMSILIKLFGFLLAIAFIALVIFIWYYFYIFQPQKMAFINEKGEEQKACLTGADAKYNEFWDRECRGLGFRESCRLPGDTLQRLDKTLTDDKTACNTNYEAALKTVNYVFPWDKQ